MFSKYSDVDRTFKNLQEIYGRFQDDISKVTFFGYLRYDVSGNKDYLLEIYKKQEQVDEIFRELKDNGAGHYLIGITKEGVKNINSLWPGMWAGVFDNNADLIGENYYGIPVVGLPKTKEEVEAFRYSGKKICICSAGYQNQIEEQLLNLGLGECTINISRIIGEQYFGFSFLKHEDEEIFVDGGVYDGETILRFMDWASGYSTNIKVIGFEPGKETYKKCKEMESDSRVTIINKGLWDKDDKLFFQCDGQSIGYISGEGQEIKVTSIDKVLNGEKATFIKMDIEGSEMEALEGARNTIASYKPKLAISLYHKAEDIVAIPNKIIDIRDDYKFYLRLHTFETQELVLYCV